MLAPSGLGRAYLIAEVSVRLIEARIQPKVSGCRLFTLIPFWKFVVMTSTNRGRPLVCAPVLKEARGGALNSRTISFNGCLLPLSTKNTSLALAATTSSNFFASRQLTSTAQRRPQHVENWANFFFIWLAFFTSAPCPSCASSC